MHTSGLYDYASDPKFVEYVLMHGHHHWTRAEQVRFAMTHGKPYALPGAGVPLRRHGLRPARRDRRAHDRPAAREPRSAPARFREARACGDVPRVARGRPPRRAPAGTPVLPAHRRDGFDPSFDLYGGGGLVSTVDDLARFYRALLHGQVFEKPATLRTMLGKPNSRRVADLGMGIFSNRIGGRSGEDCWAHSGFWGTTVIDCPASNVTLALDRQSGRQLRRAVAAVPRQDPAPREIVASRQTAARG